MEVRLVAAEGAAGQLKAKREDAAGDGPADGVNDVGTVRFSRMPSQKCAGEKAGEWPAPKCQTHSIFRSGCGHQSRQYRQCQRPPDFCV